jgi:hypothetical protein
VRDVVQVRGNKKGAVKGTASGRFTRAVQRGHLLAAEMVVREMGSLSLSNAVALCALMAREDDRRRRSQRRVAASSTTACFEEDTSRLAV